MVGNVVMMHVSTTTTYLSRFNVQPTALVGGMGSITAPYSSTRPISRFNVQPTALVGGMGSITAPYSSTRPMALRSRRVGLSRLSAKTKPSVADDLLAAGFPKDLLDYVKSKDLGDEWYEEEDDDEEEGEGKGVRSSSDEEEDEDSEEGKQDMKRRKAGKGTVHIRNSQRGIEVDLDELQEQMETIMSILGREDHDVSLWLTNDRTIREYNDRYRGKRKATDILSFGFHEYEKPEVPTQESMVMNGAVKDLGDMIISVPYVKRQCERDRKDAEEQGENMWSGERGASGAMASIYDVKGRLPYLVIHGVLHLLGHDHETDEDYAVMVAREEELIAEFRRRTGIDGDKLEEKERGKEKTVVAEGPERKEKKQAAAKKSGGRSKAAVATARNS